MIQSTYYRLITTSTLEWSSKLLFNRYSTSLTDSVEIYQIQKKRLGLTPIVIFHSHKLTHREDFRHHEDFRSLLRDIQCNE